MQQITTSQDTMTKLNIVNRVADIPGGVSLVMSTLTAGVVIPEGTPITAPATGIRTICKAAKLVASSNTTTFPVATATNPFKVGNFLCTKTGGKAYAISDISTTDGVDTITVGTAIDAQSDGWVYEAAAEAASNTSAFKNTPDSILGAPLEVPTNTQVIVMSSALVIALVLEDTVAPAYLTLLKGINVVKY